MSRNRLLRVFVSARTTVLLLCLLALMLLLNVVLPQEAVLGRERFGQVLEEGGPLSRFVLDRLGLGRMSTSPVFLGVLGLFFLNLTCVLATRVGPTWRRVALRPRQEEGLRAWARMEESFSGPLPEGFGAGLVAQALRGSGLKARKVGSTTLWGVKHRTAPLGFLLFHLSFFLVCAGGILVYYTRFVAVANVTEQQQFTGEWSQIIRRPLVGNEPELAFAVKDVDPRFEAGEPVHLGAVFVFRHRGGFVERPARVNQPAKWGTSTILVVRAGLTPVLWLQDNQGFTIDRVAVAMKSRGDEPTIAPLDEGRLRVVLSPLAPQATLPEKDQLPETSVTLEVLGEDESLYFGSLRPGEAAIWDGGRLVLEELRFWVGIRVISERGGGLLITGFVVGFIGLVWRLLWYRREVAVTWDDESFRLVGRSEFFSHRFQTELGALFSILQEGKLPTERRKL